MSCDPRLHLSDPRSIPGYYNAALLLRGGKLVLEDLLEVGSKKHVFNFKNKIK